MGTHVETKVVDALLKTTVACVRVCVRACVCALRPASPGLTQTDWTLGLGEAAHLLPEPMLPD